MRWRAKYAEGQFFLYDLHLQSLVVVQGIKRQQNLPAVSADGRLLAVGHWLGPNTHVWDVGTGQLVKTIESKQAKVAFSPDNRMLAVNEPGRCTVYDVYNWEILYQSAPDVSHTLARAVTFSPDATMLAFDPGSHREIRLLRTDNFQQIASFQLPSGRELVDHIDFSPDSSLLFESSGDVVQMWNLRLIRDRLGELDWNLPRHAPQTRDPARQIRVRFLDQ